MGSRWLFCWGYLSREDSQCAIQNLPPLALPGPLPATEPPAELELSRRGRCRQEAPRTLPPHPGDSSWRSGLARRQGVSETAGAQVVFAKRLINRPGIVPTSHGVPAGFPSPGVLSGTSPVITASPLCPGPFSKPGNCPSLGTTHHSKACWLRPPPPWLLG